MTGDEHVLEDAPCGLFHARRDGCLLRVNAYFASLVGGEPSELRGTFLDRVLTPSSAVMFHTHVAPALELHGSVEGVELTLRASSGPELEVLLSAARDSAAGGDAFVRGAVFPLHARRHLRSQLVSAQRLIDSLPGLVFQLVLRQDGSSSIPYANDAMRELHGLSAESLEGSAEAFWQSVHPDDVAAVRASLSKAARELTPWHARFRTRPRGETRHVDSRAAPQPLPDGSVLFCGYSYDVSEEMRNDELRQEKLVAERASEAKSRFLARVNHEMRNPLTAILGFTYVLKKQSLGLDEDMKATVHNLELAGKSLLELVDELLEISRIESGVEELELEPVEIRSVVSSAVSLMQPVALSSGITLDVEVPAELLAVADARRLGQVFMNLISNAIKYNRPGGRVFVRATREGRRVCVSVRDQGKGIGPEQVANLFQPFNRLGVDRGVAGTGLGLVIARTLLEHMGGTIRADSKPGQGSRFTVDLPACAGDPSAALSASA